MKNIILADFNPSRTWIFLQILEKETNRQWDVLYRKGTMNISRWKRIFNFFIFPLKILFKYKQYEIIVSWQQFYGLLLAFYLRLLNKKKKSKLIIMTFIYKPKKNFIGKVYYMFFQFVLESCYIDKLIVFSKKEVSYYSSIFNIDESKFQFIPLGIDLLEKPPVDEFLRSQKYIFSTGISNRDYNFLIDTVKSLPYKLKIACAGLNTNEITENIEIFQNVYGPDMQFYMYNSYCVVIPLKDIHISSGQLVALQALQLGKPIVITKSDGVEDYIENGVTGILITNNKKDLEEVLNELYLNKTYYDLFVQNGKKYFIKKHTTEMMAKEISNIILLLQ